MKSPFQNTLEEMYCEGAFDFCEEGPIKTQNFAFQKYEDILVLLVLKKADAQSRTGDLLITNQEFTNRIQVGQGADTPGGTERVLELGCEVGRRFSG